MSQTQPNVPTPPETMESLVGWENPKISQLIARGNLQFKRDLPRLLVERPGQYVAYSGEQCLGYDRRFDPLFRACLGRGLTDFQFTVRRIEPWDPDEVEPEEFTEE